MASHFYGAPHYAAGVQHSHGHHGRTRRGPRVSSQNHNRQMKVQRAPKELVPEVPTQLDYLHRLEAAMSFEFDDDEIFCPFHLLTEDDLHSIHSSSASDRGSLSSGSPDSSPLQQSAHPAPSLFVPGSTSAYSSAAASYSTHHNSHAMKLHQPMAQRTRNAIPIVDPASRSGNSPPSASPARQLAQFNRRW